VTRAGYNADDMAPFFDGEKLPQNLQLKGTSFYSDWGIVTNVTIGCRNGYEYVVFDWNTNSGDTAHTETVVAIKTPSPRQPTTWLSRSSGLRLERVGEWVFAFQPEHRVMPSEFDGFVADVLNLLEHGKAFPQNA